MHSGEAVVFDLNGTLFWDNVYNSAAWDSIAEKYRGTPFSEQEHSRLRGLGTIPTIRYICGKGISDARAEEICLEKENLYLENCRKGGTPSLAPGAEDLIRRLASEGRKIGIASGAPLVNMNAYREWFPVLSLFGDNVVYDDGSCRQKPAPDVYLSVMRKMGADPAATIVYEDSVAGVTSAWNAGIRDIRVVRSPLSLPEVGTLPGVTKVITTFAGE